MPVDLKPHQQEAVDKMHNGCILWGGVGTGKSITAIAYFVSKVCKGTYNDPGSMRTPKDLYIITTAKKRDSFDWQEEAFKFGLRPERDASSNFVTVTVDSWNNIERYEDVQEAFFIFDEQRVVGSGAWSQTFIEIAKRNEWVLLSATPGDTWLDYIPVFVANGWYKNRTEFKRRHCVYNTFTKYPKVERYVEVGLLVRYRNKILVHMPYERHTVRHVEDILVEYDQELMDKVVNDRWHVYEERPLRDVAELCHVMRKVANSGPSRLERILSLMCKHPKLIVFYNFDFELERLRTLRQSDWEYLLSPEGMAANGQLTAAETPSKSFSSRNSESLSKTGSGGGWTKNSDFEIAEWNGHRHEPVPDAERWVYLVQYTAGAEGWNCIETDAICFYSQTYSYKQYHQAQGRIDRLNTPFIDLWYYNLITRSLIDDMIRKNLRGKRSFNDAQLSYLMPKKKALAE